MKAVLVDTSVWVDHFRHYNTALVDLLLLSSALISPGVELWTLDKRLDALADRFNIKHIPVLH
ncbi:MAG: hypothetical protein IBX50_12785 [Marinospirillum sp.]|nr:hypothetical protein [Marinospirillum sp.]